MATTYTDEIAARICELIATTVHGLKTVLDTIREESGWAPCIQTVWNWEDARPEFKAAMELARKRQATILHDEAQEEAMRPLLGEIEKTVIKPDGREIHTTRNDNVERSKLIVQTLLKRAGQLSPSKYGDKVQAEISGKDGAPIESKVTIEFVKTKNVNARSD